MPADEEREREQEQSTAGHSTELAYQQETEARASRTGAVPTSRDWRAACPQPARLWVGTLRWVGKGVVVLRGVCA
jgi:hypothetical protein